MRKAAPWRIARRLAAAAAALLVAAAGGLASTPMLSAHATSSDVAVAYQNDPAHSGSQSGDPLTPTLTRKWSTDLQTGSVSYPLIAQGDVYVTTGDSATSTGAKLWAIDQASGRIAWGPADLGPRGWSGAAYDAGKVFTINGSGLVQSFDAATGVAGWTLSLQSQDKYLFTSAPTARNGILYTSGDGVGGALYAISESRGTVLWSQPVSEGDFSPPAVSDTGVYVSYAAWTYDFNPATGAPIWSVGGGSGGGGTVSVLFGNRLYARETGGGPGSILDASTGVKLGTFVADRAPAFDGTRGFFMSAGTVEAHDLSSGNVLWSFAGDGGLSSAPMAVNGTVYIGSTNGALYALDEATGRVLWSDNAGSAIVGNEGAGNAPLTGMGVANGLLVVPTATRVLAYTSSGTPPAPPPTVTPPPAPAGPIDVAYQVDSAHTGNQPLESTSPPLEQKWSIDLGGTVSYPVMAQGMVYVVVSSPPGSSGSSQLYALNQGNGTIVWGPIVLESDSFCCWAGTAYDAGKIFALNHVGLLRAFDAANGNLAWSRILPGQSWFTSPPVAQNGVLYTSGSGSGGTLYTVDESTGALGWKQAVVNGDDSSPAVSAGAVYTAYACQQAYQFATTDGHQVWHHTTTSEGGGGNTTVLSGGRLFVRDACMGNVVLDAATGSAVGTFAAQPPPAFDGSRGFFMNGGSLEARDAASNALLWTFAGDGKLDSAPLVVNGTVYVGSSAGNLYAVNEVSGLSPWSANAGAPITAPDDTTTLHPFGGLGDAEGLLVVPASTRLVAYGKAGVGPPPPSPPPATPSVRTASSTRQYSLSNSDGSTWVDIDPVSLELQIVPAAETTAILSANADLWTAQPGYNQDIGIFASVNGGPDQLITWKESGGNAGTFSPNAAFAQISYPMHAATSYVLKLKWKVNKRATGATIFVGAGPINGQFSPTRLTAELFPAGVSSAVSRSQYRLDNSDGSHWVPMDASNVATGINPSANGTLLIGANADLWTATPGVNQDIGLFVSTNGGADTLLGWKESGGSSGTFSPNAAFLQSTLAVSGGNHYVVSLKWKSNRPAAGSSIFAGAGPVAPFSPTVLSGVVLPVGSGSAVSQRQDRLDSSDGATWVPMDANSLTVTVRPSTSSTAVVGVNADLWTAIRGNNQDLGIFVRAENGADQLIAWKESGGRGGTFSPNAAFAQGTYDLTAGVTYTFTVRWKTNFNAANSAIFAGAGLPGAFSPTSIVAQVFPAGS